MLILGALLADILLHVLHRWTQNACREWHLLISDA
jgi:hypothetical protein